MLELGEAERLGGGGGGGGGSYYHMHGDETLSVHCSCGRMGR